MAKRKKRILVMINPRDPEDMLAGNIELGSPKEVCSALAKFNTCPDGAEVKRLGTMVLHGPGYTVEYAMGHDVLMQVMVVVNNMDFAWPVLSKICRKNSWKMQDTESGQVFG
ncbi:MAG: hypothetical protein P1U42_06320 [Phycisphaerales bacterium]|jgi:hypothetical protein|nr:hypothetical protein [Phycisphaerales bacterium]